MLNLKQIFTWWHKQTFGTFLKTIFFGKLVGKDTYGNRYYKSKKNHRWVVYNNEIEASRITSDWHHWIHHTTNEEPKNQEEKFLWQKNHSENLTGTKNAYKPVKISKSEKTKKYESWNS